MRRGFTLIDFLMVLTIIVVVTALVIPSLQDESVLRLNAAADLLRSDIELAQVMSISHPREPVAVRFDDPNTYTLYHPESGAVVTRDDGSDYIVTFGTGRARAAGASVYTVQGMPAGHLAFNELGGLADPGETPVITITNGTRWVRFTFSATTGTITETSG